MFTILLFKYYYVYNIIIIQILLCYEIIMFTILLFKYYYVYNIIMFIILLCL